MKFFVKTFTGQSRQYEFIEKITTLNDVKVKIGSVEKVNPNLI